LKENYFNTIDTIEKAYWLGVLYAEATMETRNQKPYRLGIQIGTDDEILIDRFIKTLDLNPKIKHYREKDNTVYVKFVNKTIVKDLVKWGVVPRKSKIIELPKLSKRELYLAFLLGYYDGDGKTGTTRIITGSKIFLDQIKKHFDLPYKIYEKNSSGFWRGRFIVSHAYSMSLGVNLYNEMLATYQNSLPRKRHNFTTESERKSKSREKAWRLSRNKSKLSMEVLKELVWKLPLYKIGNIFGVSDKVIKKWCIKWGIVTPPRGYWVKKRVAQKNRINKNKEKGKSEENSVESKTEKEEQEEKIKNKNKNAELQEEHHEESYEEVSQKTLEGEKEESEEETQKEEIIESSNRKDFNSLVNESREQHPFDSRFNELEEDNVYNNQFVWFSPQVRENIEKNLSLLT